MVDDHLELHEIGEYTCHLKVHFQGIEPPCMVLGQELCKMLLPHIGELLRSPITHHQPILEGIETHILGPMPHPDRVPL